jgi:VCBS repeat protein
MRGRLALLAGIGATALVAPNALAAVMSDVPPTTVWERHDIVQGSPGSTGFNGSDGVDLADLDGDGGNDVVSAYEQGHRVTVSLHPGDPAQSWGTVTLPGSGTGASALNGPEDAVFGDVDDDGALDVIVACEGGQKVTVYFAPVNNGGTPEEYADVLLEPGNWTKVDLAATTSLGFPMMRVQLADIDGTGGADIVAGGKESSSHDSALGYLTSATPRNGASWTFHELIEVGWTMQVQVTDVDDDGHDDIVYTDRDPINKENGTVTVDPPRRTKMGLRWLENPENPASVWPEHPISPVGGDGGERFHKWFSLVDWNSDGEEDVIDCRSDAVLPVVGGSNELSLWINGGNGASWSELSIPVPAGIGWCQHITVADVDGVDGNDLAFTSSHSGDEIGGNPDDQSGLIWLKNTGTVGSPTWERHEIAGFEPGIKYDNVAWDDLDGDGDVDAVTSEQHEDTDNNDVLAPGLGVIWYENPEN